MTPPAELQPFFAPHADDGAFFNPWGRSPVRGPMDMLKWRTSRNVFDKKRVPSIPVEKDPLGAWAAQPEGARLMWLGHASALVEVQGLRVLIDPVFGRVNGLMPRAAPAPVQPEALPDVHAVLLTHGHYDHLDRASLAAVAKRFPSAIFLVPLGQGQYVPTHPGRVRELDWWQSSTVEGVECTFVPSSHWHLRMPFDRDKALWGAWVIGGRVYHSGDTGYFGGFRAIGWRFPELEAAILPLGAYEPRWFMKEQHMAPEDSVQAFLDLGARRFVAMHWGTFDLTDEPLDHGPRELLPRIIEERGLDPERFHVLAHGASVGWPG